MRFEIFTAEKVRLVVFWFVTLCRLVDDPHQRFGQKFHLRIFYTEDGGDIFLRNVGDLLGDYTASQTRKPQFFLVSLFVSIDRTTARFRAVSTRTSLCQFIYDVKMSVPAQCHVAARRCRSLSITCVGPLSLCDVNVGIPVVVTVLLCTP
jgi:hypothetical protein